MENKDYNKDYKIERCLDEIAGMRGNADGNIRIEKIDSFEGAFRDYPEKLADEVKQVFKNKGIDQLYSHQSQAIQHVLE